MADGSIRTGYTFSNWSEGNTHFRKMGATMKKMFLLDRFPHSVFVYLVIVLSVVWFWNVFAFSDGSPFVLVPPPFSQSIHLAAKSGDLATVKTMIKDHPEMATSADSSWTPLHVAAEFGKRDVAEVLIAHGANVNAREGYRGYTALFLAARRGNKDVAELLLAKGADVNAKTDGDHTTPLHWAALNGHADVVKLLLANNANVNVEAKYDGTPLHSAAMGGHKDVAELLLSSGAEINARNNNGNHTPLYNATRYKHNDVAEFLRQHGAHQ
jgi:ankyrin repeat protein